MPVPRFLLVYGAQRILLPPGDTLIGRALACRVRFNDPAVSRQHLRIQVSRSGAVATNLGSNGTLLNGRRLEGSHPLAEGDVLRIGHQRIQIEVVEEPEPGPSPMAAALQDEEDTQPGDVITRPGTPVPPPEPAAGAAVDVRTLAPRIRDPIEVHTCPRCRAQVSYFDETCPSCGYSWPPGHPSHLTQPISIEGIKERRSPRYAVEVPVIYSSGTLTIDAIVRDISRGGMFIATELLDPVGTPCEVTALPDGHGALLFAGVVAHVSDDLASTRGAGIGIKFVGGSPEALEWLEATLARYAGEND